MTVKVGSRPWCDWWAEFYLTMAKRRFEFGEEEQRVWASLLHYAMWKHMDPWDWKAH